LPEYATAKKKQESETSTAPTKATPNQTRFVGTSRLNNCNAYAPDQSEHPTFRADERTDARLVQRIRPFDDGIESWCGRNDHRRKENPDKREELRSVLPGHSVELSVYFTRPLYRFWLDHTADPLRL